MSLPLEALMAPTERVSRRAGLARAPVSVISRAQGTASHASQRLRARSPQAVVLYLMNPGDSLDYSQVQGCTRRVTVFDLDVSLAPPLLI